MLKKSKIKKIIATSVMALMMAATMETGVLGMRQAYVHAAEIAPITTKALVQNTNLRGRVEGAINSTCDVIIDHHYSMDWAAIGLSRAGQQHKIPLTYLKDTVDYLKNPENQSLFESRPTEFERITLGVLAAGGDPTNVNGSGINLIEKIYNADLSSQGINALVFGLIALDSKNYEIPSNAKWNRGNLIDAILNAQCSKTGGWAFFGDNADPDMTGMAMTALAPYNNEDYPNVQKAIEDAIDILKDMQIKEGENEGGFESWGTVNSESCAQVIMGLCANKINPTEERFTGKSGKNVVDALLSFQVKEGGFSHIKGQFGGVNGMATEQALYALDQFIYHLDGKGSIYKW
ncbi:prenyltransferase/squalene oxidase repeat-containing protein [Clostridium rectalis]|uniref:prenyltransferase/squalene oxidase repeat-containing protein n=1 Tax=Clostridium rectalis TaxID=2040295 RepID=UPI000F63FE37|nr:prenyltransferase/squalene oxidase repeat-containing protein [Clostridium rectalis]